MRCLAITYYSEEVYMDGSLEPNLVYRLRCGIWLQSLSEKQPHVLVASLHTSGGKDETAIREIEEATIA